MAVNAAWRYLHAGRMAEAMAAAGRAGDHPDAASALGLAVASSGDIDSAVRLFEAEIARRGRGAAQLSNLAWAYFRAGRRDEGAPLLAELEELAERRYVSPVSMAAVYVAAGNRDRAYESLNRAIRERDRGVIFLAVSPVFAPLRGEPRFAELLERVGLAAAG